jgi:ribosomal protein S18 acetylase RimI-like enzyme
MSNQIQRFGYQPVYPIGLSSLEQVEIRPVRRDDLPALEWDGEYTHFRRLYREVFQSFSNGEALMWTADLPGRGLIGQLFVQLNSARKELADGKSRAYIYGFRVKPSYRGLGVGSRLLYTAEADLAQREFRWISLNVGRQNQDALRFYKRCGYQLVAAEPGRWSYQDDQGQRHEVHEPAWRMEKRLDPRMQFHI